MSNVHREAVRKVRSAAQCLRADAATSRDEVMRALLLEAITDLEKRADSIEEQVKPAIEEPSEFGSIARANGGKHYARVGENQDPVVPWCSETGLWLAWGDLADPEVLRIGVGEASLSDLTERLIDKAFFSEAETTEQGLSQFIESTLIAHQRREASSCLCGWAVWGGSHAWHVTELLVAGIHDLAATEQISGEAYNRGAADVVRQAIEGLQAKRAEAISAERQDAYRIAIQIVEALV